MEKGLDRNKKRDRTVPEFITRKSHKEIQSKMGILHKMFTPGNFYVIDNNSSEKELVTTTLNKAAAIVRRTYTTPPKSWIAKEWIKAQLATKRK